MAKSAKNISDHYVATFGLAGRSHVERIEIAIQDILLADAFWSDAAVCGSRIYRTPEATVWPDSAWPMITVSAIQDVLPWSFHGEVVVTLPVQIMLFYDELRARVKPAEVNSRTFAHRLWLSLTETRDKAVLKVARFGGQPLVDKPPATATVVFGDMSLVRELPDVAGDELARDSAGRFAGEAEIERTPPALGAERFLALQLDYEFPVERLTGQVPGFTGE